MRAFVIALEPPLAKPLAVSIEREVPAAFSFGYL